MNIDFDSKSSEIIKYIETISIKICISKKVKILENNYRINMY